MAAFSDRISCLTGGIKCLFVHCRLAWQDNQQAQLSLASFFLGPDKARPLFPKQAIFWLKKAADKDNVNALCLLAMLSESGYFPLSQEALISLWLKAAEGGVVDAIFRMGRIYEEGKLVEINLDEAEKWYRKADDLGHPEAMYRLKLMRQTHFPDDNFEEAVKWMKAAAERKHPEAQFFLAEMYRNGIGGEQDPALALCWYEKAAQQGFIRAQFELGMIYFCGEGVEVDSAKALEWFVPSAKAGFGESQYMLGMIYERGWSDIMQDMDNALFWYRSAAEQGFGEAQRALERIAVMDEDYTF